MESIKWLSDKPIETDDEDVLTFKKIAEAFSEMILNCDTPFTIGINGKWGSGKTSLMKLIKANIETKTNLDEHSKIHTTWFNTWNFTNEKEIWKLLMISLIEDLDKNNLQKIDIEKLLSSVFILGEVAATTYTTGLISLYSNRVKIAESAKGILDARKSKEEEIIKDKTRSIKNFRFEFERLVQKSVGDNGKYIIFIDDLDRITPDKTIEVIEAIKTFMDCKKCVFVIGCDYDYLDACVEKKYGNLSFSARDYIEKIIQITFEVSALNNQLFNIYLTNTITQFFITIDDLIIARNLIHKSIGRNPRKIKRLANSFLIVHYLNNTGLDDCLLLKLICFMQRWPPFYKKASTDLNDGKYSFKRYQDWALPLESWEEFIGYDPSIEYDYIDNQPSNEMEEYQEYERKINRIKLEVDNEFNPNEECSIELNEMKSFLQTPPFFPQNIDKFIPYISLVQSIDLGMVRIIEKEALGGLPSVEKIIKLFNKIKLLFDCQEVDGKYFHTEYKIILPKKDDIEKMASHRMFKDEKKGNIGKWFYTIIDSKSDDEKISNLINNFKYEQYDAFWIISPWGFTKDMKEFTKQNQKVYLSSYSSLKELYEVLNKNQQ